MTTTEGEILSATSKRLVELPGEVEGWRNEVGLTSWAGTGNNPASASAAEARAARVRMTGGEARPAGAALSLNMGRFSQKRRKTPSKGWAGANDALTWGNAPIVFRDHDGSHRKTPHPPGL